jgi:hypothetical protein
MLPPAETFNAKALGGVLMNEAPFGSHQCAPLRFGKRSQIAHRAVSLAVGYDACVRLKQPRDQVEKRRLARTGFAHDRQRLALFDLEGDIAASGNRAVSFAQAFGDEKRRAHSAASFCLASRRTAACRFSQ